VEGDYLEADDGHYARKLGFDQMAAPVPKIMDDFFVRV
jgi:hypothetical protein